jgi:hypothetical protein
VFLMEACGASPRGQATTGRASTNNADEIATIRRTLDVIGVS